MSTQRIPGLALALNLLWLLIILLPSIVLCHYMLIAPEEQYPAARFGEQHQNYTATVGRWIGRTPHTDDHSVS